MTALCPVCNDALIVEVWTDGIAQYYWCLKCDAPMDSVTRGAGVATRPHTVTF